MWDLKPRVPSVTRGYVYRARPAGFKPVSGPEENQFQAGKPRG